MDLGLRGRVAFITGAGGGIGRETARLLASEGARVVAADLAVERARATVDAVMSAGGEAQAVEIDVTNEESVKGAVKTATTRFGRIDIAVNSAGIYHVGDIGRVDPAAWDQLMDINLKGTYLVCRAVLPAMLERGSGSIVNLASISGRTKSTLAAPNYVASKAGVIGLTMALAAQSAARGVRVNAVAPGPTDTDMIRTLPEEMQARVLATIPLGRFATAREIANAIAYLASDASGTITGETLNINGGAFMV